MDRLDSFSRVIVNSTQEMCSTLESSYLEKVKETCKNGEEDGRGGKEVAEVYMSAVRWAGLYTPRMFCCVSRSVATSVPKHATCGASWLTCVSSRGRLKDKPASFSHAIVPAGSSR